jgi:hypothetical protein
MEPTPEPSGPASVVLDIGGTIGAAIVAAPASLDGAEIEIRRQGTPWDGTHVAVRPRHLPHGVVHAALFGSLIQGDYQVRVRGPGLQAPATNIQVQAGRVTTAELQC